MLALVLAAYLAQEADLTLVGNVRGVGEFVAFSPRDPVVDGERPVYTCSHDPLGHARIAGSFEEWTQKMSPP